MHQSRILLRKKNLLLCFDAFGTLFTPKAGITTQYAEVAQRHGIHCSKDALSKTFKEAFAHEMRENPNYGKDRNHFGPAHWWANVITRTFQPLLKLNQDVPQPLISDLITRFSSSEGYMMYSDVLPFFEMLRRRKKDPGSEWKWDKTVVGIITNSDDRVSGILRSFGLSVGSRRVGLVAPERQFNADMNDDISFVVLSYDVGHEKPHREIFDAATGLLGDILTEKKADEKDSETGHFELLLVGDDIRKDVIGSKDAKWNSVLIDRSNDYRKVLPETSSLAQVDVDIPREADGNKRLVKRQIDVIRDLRGLAGWAPKE